MFDKRGFLR